MSNERLDLSFTPTARQYAQWVEDHGRLPTQDPVYNHSEHPVNRVSVDQEHKFRESLSIAEGIAMSSAQALVEHIRETQNSS